MQTVSRNRRYWATPAVGVLIGLAYLVAFWIGGHPVEGLIGFVLMVAVAGAALLLGRRSETVRGVLDHRDERLAGIDVRATAVTAVAMIAAVLVGFVIEVAHGRSGAQFAVVAAVGGLAYLIALVVLRLRR